MQSLWEKPTHGTTYYTYKTTFVTISLFYTKHKQAEDM